jgi:hypothetical protein
MLQKEEQKRYAILLSLLSFILWEDSNFRCVRKQQEQLRIREEQADRIRAEKLRLQEIAENERELQLVEQQRNAERARYSKSVPFIPDSFIVSTN